MPDNFTEDTAIANRRYHTLVIVGIVLPFLILPFLSLLLHQDGQSYFYRFVQSRFIIWATLGLLFLYSRYGEVQPFLLWNEEKYPWWFYLQWIIILYLLCFAAQIISAIPYLAGLNQKSPVMIRMQQMMKQYQGFGYFTAITAGITEELFFRGYMMSRLALFFKNKHYVVFISALLFCSIHISYHYWGEIIFSFLLGLIFGYHYYRYRNIIVVIAVHFIVDAIAILLMAHHK